MTEQKFLPDIYRRDGSHYPPGDEGLMQWAKDFRNKSYRFVGQTLLLNGYWVATIWTGIDENYGFAKPKLIFETTVFKYKGERGLGTALEQKHYSSEAEAIRGHEKLCKKWALPSPKGRKK